MTKIRFDWRTDDDILIHIEAEVDELGELAEYDAILRQGGRDVNFIDRLFDDEQDAITGAVWNEYTQYLDDRRVRV